MSKIKITYKYLVLLLLVVLTVLQLKAQNVTVNAKLDTNQFLIGDQVGVELQVKQPLKEFVGIPNFEKNFDSEIEIIDQTTNDTTLLESGEYIIKKNVTISVFDSGYYALPPIPFLYYSDTLRTDTLIFKVNALPVDTTKAIKDIKMPYEAPLSFAEVYPWAGGGLLLALVIFIVIYVIRKIKRKEPIIKRFKPREPAHIIAYRDLDKLKNDKLWQQDKIKDYYTVLTDILRMYLWNRYAIRTLERTSEEILQSLQVSDFNDDESFETLKEIFHLSDLVKFAKYKPVADQHEKCMMDAYKFVDKTKLIIEENPDDSKTESDKQTKTESKAIKEENKS
ncbi:MAG: hypothetical protein KQH79_10015 [Bacteroidetes bacterium]|nr:hypothetical protein [Bacteroidota bacterium]